MDLKLIGNNIRKLRELKNITSEKMATKIGMQPSGYSKIERGEVDFPITRILKISDELGISVSQVFNFDTNYIFNITNNDTVNGVKDTHIYHDIYKDKYIKKLEEEIERLKK
jgi:transcriptional regulator with XRE-family HTH domain